MGGGISGTPQIWTLWQFSFWWGGGVFWDTSDLDSVKIFILGGYSGTPRIWTLWQFSFCGGILGHLWFQLCDNFHWWGILGHLGFGLYDNFHFGGRYSGTPQIWTLWQYSLGGYSGTPRIWTLWQFSFCGGILGHLRFGFYDNFHFGGGGGGEGEGEGEWEGEGEGEREGEGEGEEGIVKNRGILWDLDQNFNHSSRLMHHR